MGTGGSETGVAGVLAREINAEAAAVYDGAGARGACGGRSSSNVTMRRKIVAEASSGMAGGVVTVSVGSIGIGATAGIGAAVEGSSGI